VSPPESPVIPDEVRTAEVIGALCLATDLGIGLPFEHGLQSTIFAMRLADGLGNDAETAVQVYYGCLLFYVGCTVDAEASAELYDDGVLLTHFNPVMFGTPAQTLAGITRALAASGRTPPGKRSGSRPRSQRRCWGIGTTSLRCARLRKC
jgi:hypothetical protein